MGDGKKKKISLKFRIVHFCMIGLILVLDVLGLTFGALGTKSKTYSQEDMDAVCDFWGGGHNFDACNCMEDVNSIHGVFTGIAVVGGIGMGLTLLNLIFYFIKKYPLAITFGAICIPVNIAMFAMSAATLGSINTTSWFTDDACELPKKLYPTLSLVCGIIGAACSLAFMITLCCLTGLCKPASVARGTTVVVVQDQGKVAQAPAEYPVGPTPGQPPAAYPAGPAPTEYATGAPPYPGQTQMDTFAVGSGATPAGASPEYSVAATAYGV